MKKYTSYLECLGQVKNSNFQEIEQNFGVFSEGEFLSFLHFSDREFLLLIKFPYSKSKGQNKLFFHISFKVKVKVDKNRKCLKDEIDYLRFNFYIIDKNIYHKWLKPSLSP